MGENYRSTTNEVILIASARVASFIGAFVPALSSREYTQIFWWLVCGACDWGNGIEDRPTQVGLTHALGHHIGFNVCVINCPTTRNGDPVALSLTRCDNVANRHPYTVLPPPPSSPPPVFFTPVLADDNIVKPKPVTDCSRPAFFASPRRRLFARSSFATPNP